MNNHTIVRKYRESDRQSIREIACDTAFLGDPVEHFFEGRGFIADFLTAYFTDYEPQSCFVAETENKIVGYIIGTKNTKKMSRTFRIRIFPNLLINALFKGVFFKKKNIKFFWFCLYSFFKGQFFTNIDLSDYPAILHINLKKEHRNKGLGKLLLDVYIKHLENESISGIQLTTHSDKAVNFFQRSGFTVLYVAKRSYYREILRKDLNYYYCGIRLH